MNAVDIYSTIAVVSAGLSGVLGTFVATNMFVQASRNEILRGTVASQASVLVRGVSFVRPLATRFYKITWIEHWADRVVTGCTCAHIAAQPIAVVSCVLLGSVVLFCVGWLLGGIVAGCIVGGIGVWMPYAWASQKKEAYFDAMREALPDAVRSMAACFHAGLSQQQTFQQLAHDVRGPLAEVFEDASHLLASGERISMVLEGLKREQLPQELTFVATALEMQHEAGGTMKQVLDAAGEMLANEEELRRSLRVQTAQAKLSARVVVLVSISLVGVLSALSDGFITAFTSSIPGVMMFVCAIAMQVLGVLLVRRALNIGVPA